jgi:O-acetyl-ADP-ribose deacetylase (regulator of RNase III)
MTIRLVEGNITKAETDVIVNAADTDLSGAGGVAKALKDRFGDNAFKSSLKTIDIGNVIPLNLEENSNIEIETEVKYIFHLVTIDWNTHDKISISQLEKSLFRCYQLLENLHLRSISIPLVGAGAVGLDKQLVKSIIQQTAIRSNLSADYTVDVYQYR